LLAADLTLLWRRSSLRRRAQAFAYEVGASIFDISQGTLGLEGFGTQHCRSPAVAFPPLTQGAHSAALLFLSDDWPKKLQRWSSRRSLAVSGSYAMRKKRDQIFRELAMNNKLMLVAFGYLILLAALGFALDAAMIA
jgi:hypothetical protein